MEKGCQVCSWNWRLRRWPGCPRWWWWRTTRGRDGPPLERWTASLLSSDGVGVGGGWKWWVSILSVTAATHGGISHRVVHVLLLQLLRYVRHGGDGGLQVGREDQAEAVGVREPLQVYCTLTPKNKGERASSILCLAARQNLLQVWSPMVITTLSTRIFFWIPLMYMLCHHWPK